MMAWTSGFFYLLTSEVHAHGELLRKHWNTRNYLDSSCDVSGGKPGKAKPFLLEEESRGHVKRISEVMQSNYDWACISVVATLSAQAAPI